MDFSRHYSEEQEQFRTEVRAWLSEELPPNLEPLLDLRDLTPEQFDFARSFRQRLGAKGWLAATFPEEYGGGGLSEAHAMILAEELARQPIPQAYDLGITLCAPAILKWGTAEQKSRLLPPMLCGDVLTWQVFSEPEAGSDLASLQTHAKRDGDDYVISGQKIWIGSRYHVDYLYTLAVTDTGAPRHHNLGAFLIPAQLEGITKSPMNLIGGHGKNTIFFDNVRVPASQLIGGELDGWQVAQTTLELEHGEIGSLLGWGDLVDQLIEYFKSTSRGRQSLKENPDIQTVLTEVYVGAQVGRLLGLRNYWMRSIGQRRTYEGPQFSLYGKTFGPRLAKAVLDVVGPYALVDDPLWAPLQGALAYHQRTSLATHPGGTPEIQKVVMARQLGLGRSLKTAKTESAADD